MVECLAHWLRQTRELALVPSRLVLLTGIANEDDLIERMRKDENVSENARNELTLLKLLYTPAENQNKTDPSLLDKWKLVHLYYNSWKQKQAKIVFLLSYNRMSNAKVTQILDDTGTPFAIPSFPLGGGHGPDTNKEPEAHFPSFARERLSILLDRYFIPSFSMLMQLFDASDPMPIQIKIEPSLQKGKQKVEHGANANAEIITGKTIDLRKTLRALALVEQ